MKRSFARIESVYHFYHWMNSNKCPCSSDSRTTVYKNRSSWFSCLQRELENFHNLLKLGFLKSCVILPIVVLQKRNFKGICRILSSYFHPQDSYLWTDFLRFNSSYYDFWDDSLSFFNPIVLTNRVYSFLFWVTEHNDICDFVSNNHVPPVTSGSF